MIDVAILGMGIVGSGVYEGLLINKQTITQRVGKNINVKKILDLRKFEGEEFSHLVTDNFNQILNDKDIKVVAEVMGGINPAYDFTMKCLMAGKSVVTSNKELVAKHGAKLLKTAKENNVSYLFEASVGGGIPIIRTINSALTADNIFDISGILNGTTNYILTQMNVENKSYEVALKEAQAKGYAEKDPTSDVCGHDTCRKLAIILSLVLGKQVEFENIYTEGITKITDRDMSYAKKIGYSLKLLAKAKVVDGEAFAYVAPSLIANNNQLSSVDDVFNALYLKGNIVDEIMLYGKGAGKLPTASAVISDIIECVVNEGKHVKYNWSEDKVELQPFSNILVEKLVRVAYDNIDNAKESVWSLFGGVKLIVIDEYSNEFAFKTGMSTEKSIEDSLNKLKNLDGVKDIINKIRFNNN